MKTIVETLPSCFIHLCVGPTGLNVWKCYAECTLGGQYVRISLGSQSW